MSESSDKFIAQTGFYLRNIPQVKHSGDKCLVCEEYHVIADDLVYCATCNRPMLPHEIQREPFIPPVEVSGIVDRIFDWIQGK